MWDSSYELNVSTEQELLDMKYLLKRYRSIKHKDSIKEFRIKHDCAHCYYFEKPRRCKGMNTCFLDEDEVPESEVKESPRCSRDQEGNCPYGNESGTCFGYCWKEILNEFKEKKRQGATDDE